MQTGLGGAITGEMGNGKSNPDETFMIAALILFSNAADGFTMRIGPLKLIQSRECDISRLHFVVNIDLRMMPALLIKKLSQETDE